MTTVVPAPAVLPTTVHILYKTYLLICLYLIICLSLSLSNFHHYCFISPLKLLQLYDSSHYLSPIYTVVNPKCNFTILSLFISSKTTDIVHTNRRSGSTFVKRISRSYFGIILSETFKTQLLQHNMEKILPYINCLTLVSSKIRIATKKNGRNF